MSVDATRWAWQQEITPSQKLVLLSLADRADEEHSCYPSTARLVNDTGLHRETVFDCIRIMESMGILRVNRKYGCGNSYVLIGVIGRDDQSEKAYRYEKPDQSEKADCTSTENHTATSTENRTLNLPIEPKKNLKEKSHEITLKTYLEKCKTDNTKPIPESDPVFEFIEASHVPIEYLRFAWLSFRDEFIAKPKKQKSWPQTFRNYVVNDWLKVWAFNKDGECFLTTKGKQLERFYEATTA